MPASRRQRSVWLIVRAVQANEAEMALLHAGAGGAAGSLAAAAHPRRARGAGVLDGVFNRRAAKHKRHHGRGGHPADEPGKT